jgi:glycosyltransferase involved in cell wall biosynthesis
VAIALIGKRNRATAKIVGDPVWERQRNKKKTTLEIDEFSQSKLTLIASLQRKLLNWSLKKFDAVIVPGNTLRSTVQSWDLNLPEITVINNGVEISKEEHSGKKDFDVIAVSRLVPWKNLNVLIEACADLGLRLKVVGDGPSRTELEDLTLKFGAETTFTGEIEEHLIYREIASSEVYALISSYEGQSFSLLQAMAAGAAILVSDAPGNTNVIRDDWSGLIVRQTVKEVTLGLQRLFADRELRKRLGDNAKLEAAEKYNIEVTLRDTKKIVFDE